MAVGIKGGYAAAVKFHDALKLVTRLVNLGDAKSLACHPASTTHRQMSPEEQRSAGVMPEMIRLSIGIEHIDDILADLSQALDATCNFEGGQPMPVLMDSNHLSPKTPGFYEGSSRCITIGLINNMPDGRSKRRNANLFPCLNSASDGMQIRLSRYMLPDVPRQEAARRHLNTFYSSVDDLWERHLDGLDRDRQGASDGEPDGRALLGEFHQGGWNGRKTILIPQCGLAWRRTPLFFTWMALAVSRGMKALSASSSACARPITA